MSKPPCEKAARNLAHGVCPRPHLSFPSLLSAEIGPPPYLPPTPQRLLKHNPIIFLVQRFDAGVVHTFTLSGTRATHE